MKLDEILPERANWDELLLKTRRDVTSMLEAEGVKNPDLRGGYCFHLALLLFARAKKLRANVQIIADGGHAAVYDVDQDVSVDAAGVHAGESALHERTAKRWTSTKKFVDAVKRGWTNSQQMKTLEKILHES